MDWLGLIAVVALCGTLVWLSLKSKLDREAFGKLAETVEEIIDAIKDPKDAA